MEIDSNLKQFATEKQWEAYVAYCEAGSGEAAARKIGVDPGSLRKRVKVVQEKALRAGYAPEDFRVYKVTTQLDAAGEIKATSVQVRGGMDREKVTHIPDPKKIVKTSTLFAGDGSVTQQWVLEKPEDVEREKLWRMFAEELSAGVERAPPSVAPRGRADKDLLACYPVGDHHLGMLAWKHETGGDSYDIDKAEKLLRDCAGYLIDTVPPCEQALIAFLGDFMHYDGFDAVTPTSRHLLDADGRYPKMVRAAIRSIRHMIEAALGHHKRVHVIVEIGNHDLSSSIFLMECLHNIYENDKRVTVDTSPARYHYYEFGKTLVGTTHGDGTKGQNLPAIMATDRAAAWGRTQYRYWWTGHVHHAKQQDFVGATVESFRILAPVDAWAASKGYRSIRDMKSIVIHREHGEVARHTVNPDMFKRDTYTSSAGNV